MNRFLVTIGGVLVITGLFWPWLQKLPIGRLPGDILIQRENFRLFLPMTTSLVISVLLSLIVWFFRK